MPTDTEILSLIPPADTFGTSTWAIAAELRHSFPGLLTRNVRSRLDALVAAGAIIARERRANMILWVRAA